jgi:TRAP-type mannitol/chloroaromatic compound transport system permease large subunit
VSPEMLGMVLLAVMIVTILVGFPISFTLLLLALAFGYLGMGTKVFYLMVIQMFGFMKEEVLAYSASCWRRSAVRSTSA